MDCAKPFVLRVKPEMTILVMRRNSCEKKIHRDNCVIGADNTQSAEVLSEIELRTADDENTYCYYANSSEVKQAHKLGLSYGKYRAPTITAEEVQNMTMQEIRNLIGSLADSFNSGKGSGNGNNSHGAANRRENGKENRSIFTP